MDTDRGEVLDAAQIEDLRGVGEALFVKLVNMYLLRTPDGILRMRTHLAANDCAKIAKEAHKLKGSAGNIGAARVADTCREIENAGLAQDAAPLEGLLQVLEEEFDRSREALQAIAGPGSPAAG